MHNIRFSLEVFPPKSNQSDARLNASIKQLHELQPDFVTVTDGAGGSGNTNTPDICTQLAKQGYTVGAHMIANGKSAEQIRELANYYWDNGIRHIVALRGDKQNTDEKGDIRYASELVQRLKAAHDFEISVAGYPEKHPESLTTSNDLDALKHKVEQGASRVITQFFLDPEVFLQFRDSCVRRSIDVDIVPGLLPILNIQRFTSFAEKCGTDVPQFIRKMFDGVEPNTLDHKLLAMNILCHQITRLIAEGIRNFHFYTLNETLLTKHICTWLRAGF